MPQLVGLDQHSASLCTLTAWCPFCAQVLPRFVWHLAFTWNTTPRRGIKVNHKPVQENVGQTTLTIEHWPARRIWMILFRDVLTLIVHCIEGTVIQWKHHDCLLIKHLVLWIWGSTQNRRGKGCQIISAHWLSFHVQPGSVAISSFLFLFPFLVKGRKVEAVVEERAFSLFAAMSHHKANSFFLLRWKSRPKHRISGNPANILIYQIRAKSCIKLWG